MELVVGAQSRQGAHAHAVREEDLRGAIDPGRPLFQLGPVDVDVMLETLHGTLQCQCSGQQNEHDEVWEKSGEPDNLGRKKDYVIFQK